MYFLPIWGLKLFFWMFLEYDISVQLWCCWSNFGTRLQAIKPNVTHVWCLTEMFLASNKGLMPFVRVCFFFVVVVALFSSLKCPYDQIFDIHFFFYIFVHSASSLDILPYFNLLLSIERTFSGPLFPENLAPPLILGWKLEQITAYPQKYHMD